MINKKLKIKVIPKYNEDITLYIGSESILIPKSGKMLDYKFKKYINSNLFYIQEIVETPETKEEKQEKTLIIDRPSKKKQTILEKIKNFLRG